MWRETPEDIASRRETRQHVDDALATLNEKYRLVFVLRDIEEFSTRETAEILGISIEAVKVRLLRARLISRALDAALWRRNNARDAAPTLEAGQPLAA